MEEDQSQPKSDKPQGARSANSLDQRIVKVADTLLVDNGDPDYSETGK